ncbi:MAG: type II secretion system GspH family protein [Campylobacter sp.]|uniref:type II secretion system protein n=1 Tax=Campylobacter sp. TaxID=205 RepID=UPI002AA62CD3|nr:type II secretion system protein [Campylobacter sp.]MCI6343747.1 type II secretion system GspH family protein [Campylobacter sp.]MCI7463843.1 type II secretion system GspH family protein [Campylobacter sp.]
MKRAFSLIELLLAIVIVGVAVAALPFIATSTGKANAQAVVSEVVTSSRIFIDNILSEPWNSAITNGFTDSSGAVLYSGILGAESDDPRFVNSTKKYFSRTLAKDKDGRAIRAAGVRKCDSGINCKNKVETKISANGKDSKNALDFHITAEVKFINITENKAGKKITATFNDTAAAGTSNAILVSTTATGERGGNIIDDVNEIRLNGFAFNIGTESR